MNKQVPSGNDREEVQLEQYEALVYSSQYVDALNTLMFLLQNHDKIVVLPEQDEEITSYEPRQQMALDRFTSATTSLLMDNQWTLSQENFEALMNFRHQLARLYSMSSFHNTDYLFSIVGRMEYSSNKDRLLRLQLILSIDTNPELLSLVLAQQGIDPVTFIQLAGELSLNTGVQEELREQIIQMLAVIAEQTEIPLTFIPKLTYPWMQCSYLITDRRHLIKMALNKMVSRRFKTKVLGSKSLKSKTSRRPKTDKPIMMVMHEAFTEGHAMFRCYYQVIKSLKEKFYLVFASRPDTIDQAGKKLCDLYVEIPKQVEVESSYKALSLKLASYHPDIVYYPSIGMNTWTTVLCNFRLAPIQCMTLGHPATSASKEIDFALSSSFNDPECYTEKLIVPKDINGVYEKMDFKLTEKYEDDGYFHIAIVSSYMKINPLFLDVCKQISEYATKKLRFHFYPSATGIFYNYFSKQVNKILPGSVIHRQASYNQFMNEISQCKLRLGAFPFGGTNTTIDCMALGIPMVVLDGPEVFSHHDAVLTQLTGTSENMVAQDLDEYIRLALQFIEDETLRLQKGVELRRAFDSGILFDAKNDGGTNGDTFYWMYQNADAILNSDKKLFIEGEPID